MYDISIIIVNYNTRILLHKCLTSVFANAPDISKEVIVVENASVDGSREMLVSKWPQVKVILNNENRGYAPACNQGLRCATGRYKLALNSDAFLVGDALTKMVRFMDQHAYVCAITPKLLNKDGTIQRQCARKAPTFLSDLFYFCGIINYVHSKVLWHYLIRFEPMVFYNSINEAQVISGACTLFRSQALDHIGLLDERLILNCDDVEWSIRARKHGYQLIYFPDAEAIHLGTQTRNINMESAQINELETFFRYFEICYRYPQTLFLKLALLNRIFWAIITQSILLLLRRRSKILFKSQFKLLITAVRDMLPRKTVS